MWTVISSIEQIRRIKVNDLILQYPLNDDKASPNPSGQEENSNLFRVYSKNIQEIILEALPKGYVVGGCLVNSMKRTIDSSQLLNGKWRVKN